MFSRGKARVLSAAAGVGAGVVASGAASGGATTNNNKKSSNNSNNIINNNHNMNNNNNTNASTRRLLLSGGDDDDDDDGDDDDKMVRMMRSRNYEEEQQANDDDDEHEFKFNVAGLKSIDDNNLNEQHDDQQHFLLKKPSNYHHQQQNHHRLQQQLQQQQNKPKARQTSYTANRKPHQQQATKKNQHQQQQQATGKQKNQQFQIDYYNSATAINNTNTNTNTASRRLKAKLAKQETIEEDEQDRMRSHNFSSLSPSTSNCSSSYCNSHTAAAAARTRTSCFKSCLSMLVNFIKRKRIFIPLIIVCCIAAIYCIPYIEIQPAITKQLPYIPFNFDDGPLRSSTVSQFKIEHLFYNQIHGPESVAVDSQGNMYLAIEGGFILYAHLNKSSPIKRAYYTNSMLGGGGSATNDHQSPPELLTSTTQQSYQTSPSSDNEQTATNINNNVDLIKIAELNGIKQIPYESRRRARGETVTATPPTGGNHWQRECLLDEKFYGNKLYSGGVGLVLSTNKPNNNNINNNIYQQVPTSSLINSNQLLRQQQQQQNDPTLVASETSKSTKFLSNVLISRCSKPLGVRLSPDENYLYVIDTLSGLYRINLKVSDRPNSTQRLVNKLIDFRTNKKQLLPIVQLDTAQGIYTTSTSTTPTTTTTPTPTTIISSQKQQQQQTLSSSVQPTVPAIPTVRAIAYLNVSLTAVDDLVIDYGAGSRGGDIIYLTVGSQSWMAVSFLYEVLEGKPSGVLLRYDTSTSQLSVLDPNRVAHVRTSQIVDPSTNNNNNSTTFTPEPNLLAHHQANIESAQQHEQQPTNSYEFLTASGGGNGKQKRESQLPDLGIGAPHLDENDLFDDRPLHFPNGLELTADRSALLIADTANKRILKHYIKGPRKGTSDLWAWTPNYPDNIRRGNDKHGETYWVVGCSQDTSNMIGYLHEWPRLRKYILKNIYLIGWIIESFGHYIIGSTSVRDFGYSFKIGHSIIEKSCAGMMILQYNKYGDIIRSIYSKEFPNDVMYYSQANEVIDVINQEHILYLSSPAYNYVTKIVLPTNSFPELNSQPPTNPSTGYFGG